MEEARKPLCSSHPGKAAQPGRKSKDLSVCPQSRFYWKAQDDGALGAEVEEKRERNGRGEEGRRGREEERRGKDWEGRGGQQGGGEQKGSEI